jgi:RecJ-like exonuclease
VRYHHGRREYVVTDGKDDYNVRCDGSLPHGGCFRLEGEMSVGGLVASGAVPLEGEEEAAVMGRIRANVLESARLPEHPSLVRDEVTDAMWPALRSAALELLLARRIGRSVLLRFHGDADGIAGAFALTELLPCKAYQQNSAIYSVKDALRDIAAIGQESRPMVVLLDFGSSDGCAEGLRLLAAAGIDYLVIDHHPYNAKGEKRIINPFSVNDEASRYTAGYLGCELGAALGLERERAMTLARTACSGDKSDLVENGPDDSRRAMVLDFLASHVSFGNNLDFYRKVMEKDELFYSIAVQADEAIEEAAGKALSGARRMDEGGLGMCVFSLEHIARKGEWPPSSKITTRVFDKLNKDAPLLCAGYTDRMIILRLNGPAVGMGLSANALAERMKSVMGDFVEGGGGHARAGAIRAREGFVKDVLSQLLSEITTMVRAAK